MWLAAVIAGAVALTALLVRIFVPSVVGMADDGDGFRMLCALGLAGDRPFTADPSRAVYPLWNSAEWFGRACPPSPAAPFATQYLFVALAQAISPLFGAALDLRVLGGLLALAVALLVVALVRYLPGSTPFRLVIAAAVVVILLDSSFIDFFVSADREGVELVAVLAAFVALLILWGGYADRVTTLDIPPRGVAANLLAVGLAVLVTLTSPLLAGAFLPGFVIGLLWVPRLRDLERVRSRPVGRALPGDRRREFARKVARRAPALVACAVLVGLTGAHVAVDATRDQRAEVYDGIFLTILPSSSTPESDLEWFGLDARLAGASGAASTTTAAAEVFADAAFSEIAASDVILFTVTHPERIVALADRGMAAIASPQQAGRGNFLDVRLDDDGELLHDTRWVPVQWGSRLLYSVPLLIPAGQIAGILMSLALAFSGAGSVRSRSLGWATFFLLLGSAIIFWSTLLAPHTRLSEALLPVTLVVWLTVPLLLACAALRLASGAPPKSAILEPEPKNSWIAAATRIAAPPSP